MPKGVPNKRYTPEFKKLVVETMMKEKMSYRETARQFEISNHHRVQDWERIYLTEGPEGLAIERRGRSSKGRPPKQLPKQVEEDLLAEVQRLRAENDYLKNLQALVLEDERRQLSIKLSKRRSRPSTMKTKEDTAIAALQQNFTSAISS